MKTHIGIRTATVFTSALLTCILFPIQPAHAEETDTGNCLSYPVIWPEGELGSLSFRGTYDVEQFDGQSTTVDNVVLYHQQDPLNEWQAQSDAISGDIAVKWIDWGDDLEARDWTTNSIVRVEIVLYRGPDAAAPSYKAYTMGYIGGQGPDEMWGADKTTYDVPADDSEGPTVYSDRAYLTIQKLPGSVDPSALTWNASTRRWTQGGTLVGEVLTDGPCSAEVNVKGMVIYGYNWWVRDIPDAAGPYRLTFSFVDPDGGTVTGVQFGDAGIMTGESAIVAAKKGTKGPPTGGGQAHVSEEDNITFIDVVIDDTGTGGGGNGGGGNGGKGPGGPPR